MIWIGTSGYNYPEWKGSFYPDICRRPDAAVLRGEFPTVEINYTFYRMPTKSGRRWQAPPSPYRLTLRPPPDHPDRRMKNARVVARFCLVA